ncbi:MAG: hypothetical protein CL897_01190 [Dehalococcoidia bacterium]|nr:hypothetical protein [Dehalococcoidia bacterium]|tara:strand:- start:9190 stop:10467 length:1278 start_codon:yes stop_codon:yes gene_type:complete
MTEIMTPEGARSYLHYLLTLGIRREQSFAPLAAAFIRENDLDALGLLADEQLNLLLAAAQAFAPEPRRYSTKLDFLKRAQALLPQTRLAGTAVEAQVAQELQKTSYELSRYHEAIRVNRSTTEEQEHIIIESVAPEYFTDIAQKRAAASYQDLYHLTPEARRAQNYTGPAQQFEPENTVVHKEFEGACGPFMNARTHAFHVLLPFDLKLSRSPEDPLETGVRIFYGKPGYSFPLRYQMGQITSDRDGTVVDIPVDDPNLIYISASKVKEPEFRYDGPAPNNAPPELGFPLTVLQHLGSLGHYIQVSCNLKVWFDASRVAVLIQGTPELLDIGLTGASGLMTRTYGLGTTDDYEHVTDEPWQEGLSYNYVNLHLALRPGIDSATIPFNTPIFTLFPVLSRQAVRFEDSTTASERIAKGLQANQGKS